MYVLHLLFFYICEYQSNEIECNIMKHLKIYLLFFFSLVFFAACSDDSDQPKPRETVARTVLVYLIGDNGRSDLSSLLVANFEAMKLGMKEVNDANCNLVVYKETQDELPKLLSIRNVNGKVEEKTIFTYGEQNPLSVDVMKDVIATTKKYFPAQSYGMVFLSHSSSWVPPTTNANRVSRSIGAYRDTQMDVMDFKKAISSSFGQPLKFIFFDSCLMQSAEVAYELRNCAEYLIGSPTEIPGPGAPYQLVVPELFTETNVAKNIASAYFDYYKKSYDPNKDNTNSIWTAGVSISVVQTKFMDELATATKNIIPKYVSSERPIDRSVLQRYDFSRDDANYDFDNLIRLLTGGTANSEYTAWRIAFDKAVIYWGKTPLNFSAYVGMFSIEKGEGFSTYIPYQRSTTTLRDYYRQLEWYKAAGWSETGW